MRLVRLTCALIPFSFASVTTAAEKSSRDQIELGRRVFTQNWLRPPADGSPVAVTRAGDGLGPMFNGASCAECHRLGGVGGAGPNEDNVEIVRAFSDAAIGGNWQRVAELVDPEVEIHGTVGGLDEGRVWHGVEGLVHQFDIEDAEAWEERRLEPREFIPSGDQVVTLIHEFRRGKGSGVELEVDTAVVATVHDGRIVKLAGYMDQDAARKAAGIPRAVD